MFRYRHFAVDDENKIAYFCDRNPYKSGMFCYASSLQEPGNKWHGEKLKPAYPFNVFKSMARSSLQYAVSRRQ